MAEISDDYMRDMLSRSREYTLSILRDGPNRDAPDRDRIVWEHGRRNFSLRADGHLAIVCPVPDGSDVCGVGIFTGSPEETKRIMDEDPGVRAGIFVYELHPCRSLPGDALPA
ncbi:MAG: hypothetical protein J2P39_09685 [Candidatus Dormibacteraeota bacterium]|nr:hypothetical protein [Candidatus Dormibacteraeota bacterium]